LLVTIGLLLKFKKLPEPFVLLLLELESRAGWVSLT
jgi:hypothetical protein